MIVLFADMSEYKVEETKTEENHRVKCECGCKKDLIDSQVGIFFVHRTPLSRRSTPVLVAGPECALRYTQEHKVPKGDYSRTTRMTAGFFRRLNNEYMQEGEQELLEGVEDWFKYFERNQGRMYSRRDF